MRSPADLPGVAQAVAAARETVAHLHRHPANRRGWPKAAAAAAIRASRASALLDGGAVTVDADADRVSDPVLAGAIRVNAAIVGLAAVWRRAPLQALAKLHTLAAADLAAGTPVGRPRADPAVSARLAAMADLVVQSDWPAPVLVAIVHGELMALRPFGSADGVVARAAARLHMVSSGLDPRALTVPEVSYLRVGDRYPAGITGYADGSPEGVAIWIRLVCQALMDGAREGSSIADALG